MSIDEIEETAVVRRGRGRPKKVKPPAPEPPPTPAPVSGTSSLIASARRVIDAMAKRLGALPSAEAVRAATAQMRRTADFLDAVADKDIEAFMIDTLPAAPTVSTLEAELDEGEPPVAPAPKKRGRPTVRGKSEDVVCDACGTYGHSSAYCPERA